MSIITGRVWKYGDNVNTDVIIPAKYSYNIKNLKEMATHVLEDLDPRFAMEARPNDIIVAAKNWGCGSSREHAVTCLKEIGVGAIIAKTFGRIFYRNCLNEALPAITCPEAVEAIQSREKIEINLADGYIRCKAGLFNFPPLPKAVMEIFDSGGLIAYIRKRLAKRS